MILYHGTSKANAEKIMQEGFVPNKKYNWEVKSKRGFVYLSLAYAPFFAMNAKSKCNEGVLIKCDVREKDLYPDDDFVMLCLHKKEKYTQGDINKVDLEYYKPYASESIRLMGNACARPEHIKILGISPPFNTFEVFLFCDIDITPKIHSYMGEYYRHMSERLFEGERWCSIGEWYGGQHKR